MSFVDQLGNELAGGGLAADVGSLLRDFVLGHRELLESLGEAGTRRLFGLLASGPGAGAQGGDQAGWDQAVGGLDQPAVLAFLEVTAGQLAEAAEGRERNREATQALLGQLSQVAWRVATGALLAAL